MKLNSVNLKVDLGECKKRVDGADWFVIVFKNSQTKVAKIYPGDITRRSGEYYVDFSAREYSALALPNEECEIFIHSLARKVKENE